MIFSALLVGCVTAFPQFQWRLNIILIVVEFFNLNVCLLLKVLEALALLYIRLNFMNKGERRGACVKKSVRVDREIKHLVVVFIYDIYNQ